MNSYRLVKILKFPDFKVGDIKTSLHNLSLPGFLEDATTIIRCLDLRYFGYELFEIEHEMLIKDSGLAFGFIDYKPIKLEFTGYKKRFTIRTYLNRDENYLLFSQNSIVVKDLYKTLKTDKSFDIQIEGYILDLNKAQDIVKDYNGVWFKGVSTRVSSSALFGSDLANDALFQQLQNDGANLSSIIIPFNGIPIQIGENAGISSHQKIDSIEQELKLVEQIKNCIIDKLEK